MSLDQQRLSLEILLDKINHLYKNLSSAESAANRLELDLLQQYTKEFYEGLKTLGNPQSSAGQAANTAAPIPSPPIVEQTNRVTPTPPIPPKVEVPRVEVPAADVPKVEMPKVVPPKVETPKIEVPKVVPKVELPKVEPPKVEIPKAAPPKVETPNVELPKVDPPKVEAPKDAAPPDFESSKDPQLAEDLPISSENLSLNDRFSGRHDLASTINTRNKDDLRKVIDVNERFLFIKELFKSDSEAYNAAVRRLNELGNFGAATHYVNQELVGKYGWDLEDNAVKHFLDIVRKNMSS